VLWDFDTGSGGEGTGPTEAQMCAIVKEGMKVALLERFRRRDGAAKAAMRRSWRERREIYRRGGRGYWAEGDLSRVEWTTQGEPGGRGAE